MPNYYELLVSANDAEVLAVIVGERARANPLEAEAADALADILLDARMVPHERLPADCVGMNSLVSYREEPEGPRRTVAVVHPNEANPAEGRVSVLSPVGRALLGRKPGAVIAARVPGGGDLRIHILRVEKDAAPFANNPGAAS
ncbi:MAG TPA: GreA/GreB family elongation factor [Burkholderiales bacterium]|nr:GreA/GreB family elongation factor [Burkholderiales bacterium]